MTKTGTAYKKPYGKEVFGTETVAYYAYPREKLIAEPIFPYLVLDGGAYHFCYDHYGDVDSDHLLELTMNGELFREFTQDEPYKWEKSFAYVEGTPFRKKYEWQIWPQRMYMTIPLAHAFLRTGDRQYADKWLEIIEGWDKAHPYQAFDPEVHYLKTDMTWRDMQVAWRTMSLLHGLFMLQDAPFTEEQWRYLYSFVELHMRHMYEEALDRLARNHAQNHVLQIGVVLIMAGVMFPEFENAAEIIKIGRDTVEMNMRKAIYPDGGSNEDSPSYNHFIVRLYMEAKLLLEQNGQDTIEGLDESIVRQYEWIYQCCSPEGRALRISDSYGIDAMADLRRAEELISLDFPREKKSMLFPDSRMAVLRKGKMTLFADAMEWLGGHQHVGRPQILLFYGNAPVIVDSGCCSYDRWEFYLAVNSNKMHNVLWCPDFEDKKCSIDPQITVFDAENGVIVLETKVGFEGKSYTWQRKLTMDEHRLIIEDTADSEEALRWASRLFFRQNDTHMADRHTMMQLTEEYLMTLKTDAAVETELVPVMNDYNKIDYAVVLQTAGTGEKFAMHTEIEFADR